MTKLSAGDRVIVPNEELLKVENRLKENIAGALSAEGEVERVLLSKQAVVALFCRGKKVTTEIFSISILIY